MAADIIRKAVEDVFNDGLSFKDWCEYEAPALEVAGRLEDVGLLNIEVDLGLEFPLGSWYRTEKLPPGEASQIVGYTPGGKIILSRYVKEQSYEFLATPEAVRQMRRLKVD